MAGDGRCCEVAGNAPVEEEPGHHVLLRLVDPPQQPEDPAHAARRFAQRDGRRTPERLEALPGLLERREGAFVLSSLDHGEPEEPRHMRREGRVVSGSSGFAAGFDQGKGRLRVPLSQVRIGQIDPGLNEPLGIPEPAIEVHRLAVGAGGGWVVVVPVGEAGQRTQGGGPLSTERGPRWQVQDPLDGLETLDQVPLLNPEHPHRSDDAQPDFGSIGSHRPFDGRTHVVVIASQRVGRLDRVRAADPRAPLFDERREELPVPSLGLLEIELRPEPFRRELADGLEHRESRALGKLPSPDEAVVEQRSQPLERLDAEILSRVADASDRPKRGAAGEGGEPGEQPPLGLIQELIAPVDRPSKRSLPLRNVRRSRPQRETMLQPGQQL